MSSPVKKYITEYNNLINHFDCDDNYLIHDVTENEWQIEENGEIFFLHYWFVKNEKKVKESFVMVKKDGSPLIYQKGDFSLVIAINCIKMGFLLNNKNKK